MNALNNDTAYIIAFACESFLYGIYIVLFTASAILSYRHRHIRPIQRPLMFAYTFLFLLCTTHFALEFNHFCVYLMANGVVGYADETKTLWGADMIMSLLDFVGECVLIYRLYIIWARNWRIITLPFLAAFAGFVCVITMMCISMNLDPTSTHPPQSITPLGTVGYSLPLATNVMVTSLIVLRIWLVSHGAPREFKNVTRRILNAMEIVVESGLIYLVAQLVYVVLFSLDNPGDQIAGIIAVQIYGISPTLIAIRVALGLSDEFTSKISTGALVWAMRPPSIAQLHIGVEPVMSITYSINKHDSDVEKGSD